MAHIVVLIHKHASITDAKYYIPPLEEVWREQGHSVTILAGVDRFVEADIAIMHVNLTVISKEYQDFLKRYPRVINGGVTDISKRAISKHLVGRDDDYNGPVVVKTNLNHGGKVEARLATKGSPMARYGKAVRRRLHWTLGAEIPSANYRCFDSKNQVPWTVWRNNDLVVEKLQPEMMDGLYCLRSYMFLGDQETSTLFTAKEPIIKASNFIDRMVVDLPDEVRQIRREMNFDFGKFDFVLVDGKVVIYDVNHTPTLGTATPDSYMPRVRSLAEGLKCFL